MKDWMTELTKGHGVQASTLQSFDVISLKSPSLNWAAGNGGFREGKTILLAGPESSGKSLIMYLAFVEQLNKDPNNIVALFDTEFSFDPAWFKKLGGDPSRVINK
jgi:RecA/RadA recombinase